MSSKELPLDRLATTDPRGNRIYLYPAAVQGKWQRLRSGLSVALIVLFLGLPWMRIGGHQALLLDIPHRRFAILGLTFWAHDIPLLFFLVGSAVILIAFITAIWGRIWCGWACPQTVFVDHVFRRIERIIEGDAIARRKLDEVSVSFEKILKKGLKWGSFTLIALFLSHSFMAYFIGTEQLGQMISQSPTQNLTSFFIVIGIAGAILFDFGWFREQFCTIVCPYGRFQSVLMDRQSTVVAYDWKRGEPRRGSALSDPTGDCVNCYRCVQVCPTGIDIRRGVQLECIACTACIDACDDVMTRMKKPRGLIRYGSHAVSEGKEETFLPWYKRTRGWIYLFVLGVSLGGLVWTLNHRAEIELIMTRATDSPYQEILSPNGQGHVINHFVVNLRNQTFSIQKIEFSLNSELKNKDVSLIVSNHKSELIPGEPDRVDLFVRFPKSLLKSGRAHLSIQLNGSSPERLNPIVICQEVNLVGPLN